MGIYGSADRYDEQAQKLQSQGYQSSSATGGASKPIENQFWFNPNRGTYETVASVQARNQAGQNPWGQMPTAATSTVHSTASSPAKNFGAYSTAMLGLLGSAAFKPVASPLEGMIDPAYKADIAAAQQAYANAANGVAMSNPYAALANNKAPQLNADMGQFLQSQGIGGGDYNSAVAAANAQLGAGAGNWNALAGVLGQNHLAAQQGTKDLINLQGQNTVAGLQADQQAAHNAAQMQNWQAQQQAHQGIAQALLQLLGQGYAAGAKMPNLSAFLGGM